MFQVKERRITTELITGNKVACMCYMSEHVGTAYLLLVWRGFTFGSNILYLPFGEGDPN